jgi:hypothetical protein
VLWIGKDIRDRTRLDDGAQIHDGNVIGDVLHDGEIV